MSDIERERVRKEAADAITSRPPSEGESRVQAAMRRYLGASLFTNTRNRSKTQDDAASPSSNGPSQPDDQGS
jgi:hypothetical protein